MKLIRVACIVLLLLLHTTLFAQLTTSYFKDTINRSFNAMCGTLNENDQYIYYWGNGIGKYLKNMPMMHKIDTAGKEIWNTGKSPLLAFDGTIIRTFADAGYLYAFGFRSTPPWGYFRAKIDKVTGTVIYEKDSSAVNTDAIIDMRDVGTDSIRVVCFAFTDVGQPGDYNLPAVSTTISKSTGIAAPAKNYGNGKMAPLFIDQDDNAYYFTTTDSLVKYHTPSATVRWKNKTQIANNFFLRPATHLVKEGNKVFLFGDRFCRGIDDNTGLTIWNITLPSRTLEEFWPYSILIKADTIYTSWHHPYSGSVDEYGHFSKVNKLDGTVYMNGTVADNGGVSYNNNGSFKDFCFSVDSVGDIYMLGHYYKGSLGTRAMKKISRTGALINEVTLLPDTIPYQLYNVVPGANRDARSAFLFHNQAYFLFPNLITNKLDESVRAGYLQISPSGTLNKRTFYDNNYYQYPSCIIDIQKKGSSTYVLKKQGGTCYVEKLSPDNKLVWSRNISLVCFFNPQAFAIDSSENICVTGSTPSCELTLDASTLSSFLVINHVVFLDKNGNILKDLLPGYITNGDPVHLLGADKDFYLVNSATYNKLDPVNGLSAAVNHGGANFASATYNNSSNNAFLLLNNRDSIYIFSSHLSASTHALCIAVSKATGQRRTASLAPSFLFGNLLHAVRSTADSNIAYVSGQGEGAYPGVMKYNYKTNTVLWKYTDQVHGEAVKVVEEPDGNLYALLRITDSTKVIKVSPLNGNIIWKYARFEFDRIGRSVDIDVSTANKMVIAAGSSFTGGFYRPFFVELNSDNGALLNLRTMTGNAGELNFIRAVESLPGSAILVGGNLTSDALDGRNGFMSVDGAVTTCNVSAAFTAVRDISYPARFTFTNKSTPDTGALSFKWSFGNGDSAFTRNTSYTYRSAGTYKVSLTVTRNTFCSSTTDSTIVVTATDACPVSPAFTSTIDTTVAGRVTFQNQTVTPAGTKYSWNFGDGSPADTTANPEHIYKKSGNYTICLQATLNNNCIKTSCDSITLHLPNGGRLSAYPNPASQSVNLVLVAAQPPDCTIRIMNFSGFVVQQLTITVQAGTNVIPVSLAGLASGIYFIEVDNGGEKLRTKILKL